MQACLPPTLWAAPHSRMSAVLTPPASLPGWAGECPGVCPGESSALGAASVEGLSGQVCSVWGECEGQRWLSTTATCTPGPQFQGSGENLTQTLTCSSSARWATAGSRGGPRGPTSWCWCSCGVRVSLCKGTGHLRLGHK